MNELNDFLLAFSDLPDERDQTEFNEVMEQYQLVFGSVPPLEMVPPGFSEADIIKAVKKCIEQGNADLLQVIGVCINENFIY